MNKIITTLLLLFSFTFVKAQVQLIPDSVYFVMEVDLGKVIKSVPIEDINKFEVIRNNLSHLTDLTEDIKDIAQLGVDFNSKLIAFTSENEKSRSTTVILPIIDRNKFIQFFDDIDQLILKKNNPIIKDDFVISVRSNECIITSVEWKNSYLSMKTKNLFEEKDWKLPDNYYYLYGYDYIDYGDDFYDDIYYEESIYEEEYAEDAVESYEDNEEEVVEESDEDVYYEDDEEVKERELEIRFQEVMDSIKEVEKMQFTSKHLAFFDNPKNNLLANDPIFRKMSSEVSDAKLYYNPSMNPEINKELIYQPFGNFLHKEFNDFRQFAYLNFTSEGIKVDWKLKSSEKLGKVINKAASDKLNRKLLKYVPDYAQGFAIYNINSFGAYEQLKETYLPILDASEDGRELLGAAIWSTIDEFINMEAITSLYPPQLLMTYGGLKEVELNKVSYDYDEETFQYTEVDTTYMEKIPMVSFVLANERAYLLEKYFKAIMKLEEGLIEKNKNYYTVLEDPAGIGMPYYVAIRNDIIIVTNDKNTVENHLDGFNNNTFDRAVNKKMKKAKMLYAHLDLSQVTNDIVALGLNKSDDFIKRFEDKTAKIHFEVASIDKDQINFSLSMETNKKYKNGAYFLFELINELYLMNK